MNKFYTEIINTAIYLIYIFITQFIFINLFVTLSHHYFIPNLLMILVLVVQVVTIYIFHKYYNIGEKIFNREKGYAHIFILVNRISLILMYILLIIFSMIYHIEGLYYISNAVITISMYLAELSFVIFLVLFVYIIYTLIRGLIKEIL